MKWIFVPTTDLSPRDARRVSCDWSVALITMRVCCRLPAPRSCPDAHLRPLPFCSRNQICPRLMRRGLFRLAGVGGWPGYVGFKQRAAYVGDVHYADQAGVSD